MELNFYTLCVLYLVYSFLGWVAETVVATIKGRAFVNRGVASGPFCFVYGTAAVLMAVGFSTPAFAFVDTTEVTEEPTQVIEEAEPTEEEKIPFTIAGNGEVEDDIVDDPSKEFFTVKTKGGNTFFLVIDRARNSENVYMLSMIDEYDLQEFLDDEERNGKQEEETPAVVLPETKPESTPDVEIEEPKEESSGGMNKILLLVFVAALGGAGAFFYFYIYKPKPKEETPQSENLETDQSLATVNEDNQSGNENGT